MFEPVMVIVRSLAAYIAAHPFEAILFIVVWWTFSALASALPTPRPEGPVWYKVVYNFAHAFSGSLVRIESIREVFGKLLKTGT